MKVIDFKNEIWDFMRVLSCGMENSFRCIIESKGLTMIQARTLVEISMNENSTVGSVAKQIGLSSGNASNLLKKLEKEGFIKRVRSKNDERVVTLQITDKGQENLNSIEHECEKRYETVLKKVSEDDFDTVVNGLKKLKEILQNLERENKRW